ncbi:MAG: GHKL domain-containing protein [Desulfobacterales bacterium]|nr:GHKL domain-containing protein [Desulfobacterales bacterium]
MKNNIGQILIKSGRPTIRVYLTLMNIILLCLLFPSISIVLLREQAEFRDTQLNRTITQMRRNLENTSASLARSMALSAGQAVAGYDFTFLNIMAHKVAAHDPEIVYCIVMDAKQISVAHSDPAKLGSILEKELDFKAVQMLKQDFPETIPGNQETTSHHSKGVRFSDGTVDTGTRILPVMEAVVPVYNGSKLWGVLRCSYSLERLREQTLIVRQEWAEKMEQFKFYLFTITIIFFSVGVFVAALFTRFFAKATDLLRRGVSRVSEGNLDHEIRQPHMSCAEFVELSGAFNTMTAKLKTSYQQLDEYSKSLEQKVMERTRELREAQANLMQQAHEAGMAEMAVGILHNIGNAITPAKVGALLLLKRLKESPVRNHLHEAMAQIHEAAEASPALSGKEKTRLLDIIRLVPESIREEYDKIIDEIERIRHKHEHIEGIISLQMRYAHLFGESEEVDVEQVANDALEVLNESISKRSLDVVKNFAGVPLVKCEQAKLIQIIVNLIKNAIEAVDRSENREKRIEISTCFEENLPAFVMLSVRDTGIGFSSEEKKKFFTFGYTTKEKGSGFGLHTCANYLIANNGSITAHSEGKGKGASFVVRLAVEI